MSEYYERDKENIKKYQLERYYENKKERLEYQKKYYKKNCDLISDYNHLYYLKYRTKLLLNRKLKHEENKLKQNKGKTEIQPKEIIPKEKKLNVDDDIILQFNNSIEDALKIAFD